jgi:hypothetical protein
VFPVRYELNLYILCTIISCGFAFRGLEAKNHYAGEGQQYFSSN